MNPDTVQTPRPAGESSGNVLNYAAHPPVDAVCINCPQCLAKGVIAHLKWMRRPGAGYYRPRTWMICTACRKLLYSRRPPDVISGLSPADLERHVRVPYSLAQTVFPIIALIVFFAPVMNVAVSIVALIGTRSARGWRKKVSWIALVLGLLLDAYVGVIILLGR